ncbi:endo alpha-1,4 polygalactosaminidase [Chelatococcus sambhunathii]|uniref:Endo alpha-1,4 polygalactosaminidase n=1 Tax=Chelatococcus sambhunathii TaxID=363953 RepID=A0ABU1DEW3_9HYPH|nr:endo alpha-1,4 polygalactosaminidase [Chelatococcus sambhunathii]MDR4306663.1 endo alpha-1,4 polygalactosaminidase [Chelatococcus sambhunathii]
MKHSVARVRAALAAATLALSAAYPVAAQTVTPPPANAKFDYQIGGAYTPADSVGIVVRDRLAAPAAGKYNICYVNAFQSQPGDGKWWRKNHPDLLVQKKGEFVTDPDWPGEHLFDTSTPAKRDALMSIVGPWIDQCAQDGFKAIEADNLDSWTRSRKMLRKQHNAAFATLLSARAHAAGLAIAQKNTTELASIGASQIGFDFAIAEECQIYSECKDYTEVYGDQVYEIEYNDNKKDGEGNPIKPIDAFNAACEKRGSSISVIYRDRDVLPRGKPRYEYKAC